MGRIKVTVVVGSLGTHSARIGLSSQPPQSTWVLVSLLCYGRLRVVPPTNTRPKFTLVPKAQTGVAFFLDSATNNCGGRMLFQGKEARKQYDPLSCIGQRRCTTAPVETTIWQYRNAVAVSCSNRLEIRQECRRLSHR